MRSKFKPAQLRALSDFANMVSAAWFTAGIIAPFFAKPKSLLDLATFVILGLLMTWATLRWSLYLMEEIDGN